MLRFVLRRLAFASLLVLVVTSLSFVLVRVAPGDYFTEFGPGGDRRARAERAAARLDRPLVVQYAEWLSRAVRFDLGTSLKFQQPVTVLVARRAAATVLLGSCALVLATICGITLGVFTGAGEGAFRSAVRAASTAVLAVPPLVISLALTAMAAHSGWLPPAGLHLPNMVIPIAALAVPAAAWIEQVHSQAIRRTLSAPHILAARARGLTRARVLWKHASRDALGTTLSVYGILAGSIMSGSFAVELVADWPGLALLTADALRARDPFLVCGCSAAAAGLLVGAILVADVLHVWVDPRLRS